MILFVTFRQTPKIPNYVINVVAFLNFMSHFGLHRAIGGEVCLSHFKKCYKAILVNHPCVCPYKLMTTLGPHYSNQESLLTDFTHLEHFCLIDVFIFIFSYYLANTRQVT